MLSSTTKKKIDTARDILVGKIPMPTSQVEQITLALIYKFMSDMDKKTKDLGDTSGFFANGYEKYSWDKLMNKALPARDRVLLYREALEKMALNPHIPQLFRDIFRNASLPFNDPETLKLFLDIIDQFEYDHSEELGNAFEYLLQVMGSQGDAGQFRTPRHIIDFIVEVVDPQKTDTILDPACGTAGFLISAYKHLRKNGLTNEDMEQVSNNFVGYDISQDMQRLSLVNMYLHHFPDPHIYEYDSLSSEDRWNDDFDVILANPPFMTPKGGIRPHNRFSVPSNRAEVLFVDYIMEHLTTNGKAGVIVPEGIIFQSQNAYKALRKMMVDDDYLWAVVSLPSGVFQPYSGVKTSILLFDRQLAKKTNKILFVKVENDGFDLGAQRRVSKLNDLPEAIEKLKKYKKSLNDEELTKYADNNVTVATVNKKIIADNDYNLSAERYLVSKVHNSNYDLVKLEKMFSIIRNGKNVNQNDSLGKYRVTRIKTIADKILNLNETKWTNDEVDDSYFIKNGDILFSHINSYEHLGKTAIVENVTDKVIHGVNLILLRPNEEIVHPKYASFLFRSEQFLDKSKGYAQKAVNQASIKVSDIKELEIPLPPLSVQKEIVDELDRYQKIIDGAKQVVDNYQPSFQVEDDWELVELSQVCELKTGTTPSTSNPEYYTGTNPFIKTGEIDNCIITSANTHISDKAVSDYNLKVFDPDTIFMAMYGQGKTRGKVALLKIGASTTQNAAAIQIKDKSKLLPEFLYFFLLGQYGKLRSHGIDGHISHLNLSLLSTFKVPVPTLNVQKEIVKKIKSEQEAVSSSSSLVEIFEKKISDSIDEIWGK